MRHGTIGAIIATVALLAAAPVKAEANNKPDAETYELIELFGEVFEKVRRDYVEPPSDRELIESALNGMLAALDPHSSYLTADSFEDMQVQTRGQFGGLGIQVTMENGLVKVISPIDDTPAARAGLKPGDLITHLDDEAVMGLGLDEAVERMRGPPDSDITLTIRRGTAEPFDVVLTRAIIKLKSVRSRTEGKVGYVRITSFTENTADLVRDAIADVTKEIEGEPVGFVLDLRNNPGGLLDQAVEVADLFLDSGEIVSTRARHEEESERYNAREGDIVDGLPLVVLINDGSASASEIVAGALQDHRRAILLGTRTFGKGSVQTVIPLPRNGAMRLTTARYYTPSGVSIQAKGIEPDIKVELATIERIEAGPRRGEDRLRNALDASAEEAAEEAGEDAEAAPKGPTKDYQLSRALDLLRGLSLYRKAVVN